jgi:endoglucanase
MTRQAIAFVAACIVAGAGIGVADAANDVLNPNQRLYVNWHSNVVAQAPSLSGQDRANALTIGSFPSATWLTFGTPADVRARAAAVVTEAAAEQKIPVIVAYYIPFRDCQHYSAGGAQDTAQYKAWIDGLAAGIGQNKAVVLLEPDGLGIIPYNIDINGNPEWCRPADLDPATAVAQRYEQMNYAVDALKALPNTAVYLDGTHSGWLGTGDIAQRLMRAGVQRADGFFINVSNYEPTEKLDKYGTWVAKCIHYGTNPAEGGWRLGHFEWCASQYFPANPNDFSTWGLTDQWYADNVDNAANPPTPETLAHFVTDTSRNGQGPWSAPPGKYTDAEVWCNPPGRGLGARPTTNTGDALIDARLWVKVPGESDGACLRGTAGPQDPERGMVDPNAGGWFREQAAELVSLAQPAVDAPTCRVTYQVFGSWRGGFITQITVKNLTQQKIDGWKVRWSFGDGESIQYMWGADSSQAASVVTAQNLRWNRIIAPGQAVTFGFIGDQDDAVHDPSFLFYLNDRACSVR